jgi:hypothetical protein
MEQSELLRYFTRILEQLGLRYFVNGSVATIFFGEPRFTNDIDIVVDLPASRISELCRILPSEDAFNRSRFARARRLMPAPDYDAVFASPEDVILKKLEYHREGGSDKHLRDIAGVLKISGDQLDLAYLDDRSSRLGLADLWAKVRATLA